MYERSWTVLNDGSAAAVAVIDPLSVPDGEPELELEAWQSSNATLTALVLRDGVTLAEAQNRVSQNSGTVDAICSVPNAGRACVRIDPGIRALTVFFPFGDSGGVQTVTVRIRQVK